MSNGHVGSIANLVKMQPDFRKWHIRSIVANFSPLNFSETFSSANLLIKYIFMFHS